MEQLPLMTDGEVLSNNIQTLKSMNIMKNNCDLKLLASLHLSDIEILSFFRRNLSPWQESRIRSHLTQCDACRGQLKMFGSAYAGVNLPGHVLKVLLRESMNSKMGITCLAKTVERKELEPSWRTFFRSAKKTFLATSFVGPENWRKEGFQAMVNLQKNTLGVKSERLFIVKSASEQNRIKGVITAHRNAGIATAVILESTANEIRMHFPSVKTLDFGLTDFAAVFEWNISAKREFAGGVVTPIMKEQKAEYPVFYAALKENATAPKLLAA